jgi:hypothetical protein
MGEWKVQQVVWNQSLLTVNDANFGSWAAFASHRRHNFEQGNYFIFGHSLIGSRLFVGIGLKSHPFVRRQRAEFLSLLNFSSF